MKTFEGSYFSHSDWSLHAIRLCDWSTKFPPLVCSNVVENHGDKILHVNIYFFLASKESKSVLGFAVLLFVFFVVFAKSLFVYSVPNTKLNTRSTRILTFLLHIGVGWTWASK